MTFKEEHREFQELVREHKWLRDHNRKFKEEDSQGDYLLFAEAALVIILLERFLRMILKADATEKDTLPNLLEKATSKRHSLIQLPGRDRGLAIRALTDVRNTLLHGNFEQAAKQAGAKDVKDYFKNNFASDVEALYQLGDYIIAQIDPLTGKRR